MLRSLVSQVKSWKIIFFVYFKRHKYTPWWRISAGAFGAAFTVSWQWRRGPRCISTWRPFTCPAQPATIVPAAASSAQPSKRSPFTNTDSTNSCHLLTPWIYSTGIFILICFLVNKVFLFAWVFEFCREHLLFSSGIFPRWFSRLLAKQKLLLFF
jgi:hypothetical protein